MLNKKSLKKYGKLEIFEKTNTDLHIKITDGFHTKKLGRLIKYITNNVKDIYPNIISLDVKNNLFEYKLSKFS